MIMNTVSKMTIICIVAILVVVISSGSDRMINVKAVSNATKQSQIVGIECEDLYAKLTNGHGDIGAMQKKFDDKDCWTKLAQLNAPPTSPAPPKLSNQTSK